MIDRTWKWSVSGYWSVPNQYVGTPVEYTHILPLPDGRAVVSIYDGTPPETPGLWLLDENAVIIDIIRPGSGVTGFAYDGGTGNTYVAGRR